MKENIFSNFYAKVLSFFTSGKEEGETSRDNATNRLKLVLMQDRSNLDGATMQKMREQLITVISKYIEIDTEALDLNLEGDGEEIALMLNIPVIRARTREEIEELEEQEKREIEEAKQAAIEEALKSKEENNEENDASCEEEQDDENKEETENENTEENVEENTQEEQAETAEEAGEENKEENAPEDEEETEEKPKRKRKDKENN